MPSHTLSPADVAALADPGADELRSENARLWSRVAALEMKVQQLEHLVSLLSPGEPRTWPAGVTGGCTR